MAAFAHNGKYEGRPPVCQLIQTLQVECLDKFVIVREAQLNHITGEYTDHYNRDRPHESCGYLPPDWVPPPDQRTELTRANVVQETQVGGLLKSYWRRAA